MYNKYETILLENEDGITTLTFNRPQARNAMSPQFHRELELALAELRYDDKTRVVVLTGAGNAWCAGQDLKLFFYERWKNPASLASAQVTPNPSTNPRLFPKPTIAMVNGYVFGGAFPMLAACDIAVAAEDAIFGLSEVNWGIVPGGSIFSAIPEVIPFRDLLYYSLTGETFTGKQAAEMRLVNFAVPREQLREKTWQIAGVLKSKDPMVLEAIKVGCKVAWDMNGEQQWTYIQMLNDLLRAQTEIRGTGGGKKGIEQFVDKKYRPGFGAMDWETKESHPH